MSDEDNDDFELEPDERGPFGKDLRGVDLRGRDLTEADLSGADLTGADLGGANLTGVDLAGATLDGAYLRGAVLTRANLTAADLVEADLVEANLAEANFSNASLANANLTKANLSKANLNRADLTEANLTEADLAEANLAEARLYGADLTGADLTRVSLHGARLADAIVNEADLRQADLDKADLSGTSLCGSDLRQASLVDACLDRADLTDTKLWETQRGGWPIKGVVCQRAFWARDGNELSEYRDGEFEQIFAELPRIFLRYPEGMSAVDLIMLPIIVERLQEKHKDSLLCIRSMQNEGKNGGIVTITVEDRAGRAGSVAKDELLRLQTALHYVEAERDRLTERLMPRLLSLVEASRQVNIGQITGQMAIGGVMSGDNYTTGQAGVVGRGAHARDITFQQIWNQSGVDLSRLVDELGVLRRAMKREPEGPPEQDEAIGAVAAAEKAAAKGDGPVALQHLRNAGKWALQIAEKVGVTTLSKVMEKAMLS